jgi:hypothetical protein
VSGEIVEAANLEYGSEKVLRLVSEKRPRLTERIVSEILKVKGARYLMHWRFSPECSSVAGGAEEGEGVS